MGLEERGYPNLGYASPDTQSGSSVWVLWVLCWRLWVLCWRPILGCGVGDSLITDSCFFSKRKLQKGTASSWLVDKRNGWNSLAKQRRTTGRHRGPLALWAEMTGGPSPLNLRPIGRFSDSSPLHTLLSRWAFSLCAIIKDARFPYAIKKFARPCVTRHKFVLPCVPFRSLSVCFWPFGCSDVWDRAEKKTTLPFRMWAL